MHEYSKQFIKTEWILPAMVELRTVRERNDDTPTASARLRRLFGGFTALDPFPGKNPTRVGIFRINITNAIQWIYFGKRRRFSAAETSSSEYRNRVIEFDRTGVVAFGQFNNEPAFWNPTKIGAYFERGGVGFAINRIPKLYSGIYEPTWSSRVHHGVYVVQQIERRIRIQGSSNGRWREARGSIVTSPAILRGLRHVYGDSLNQYVPFAWATWTGGTAESDFDILFDSTGRYWRREQLMMYARIAEEQGGS